MSAECDIKKKVSYLESFGKKICSELRNFHKERAILSREAKCLLKEIEKRQKRRRHAKNKKKDTACACAAWEKDLLKGGGNDIDEFPKVKSVKKEPFSCTDSCNCRAKFDLENDYEDILKEMCKDSSSRHYELDEPCYHAQPVENDNDGDDDLDDVKEDYINDMFEIQCCDGCAFCEENNGNREDLFSDYEFNVSNDYDMEDLIERERGGGGGYTDSESSRGRTTNLSNCTCKCDICILRNKRGEKPPCCRPEIETLDHLIDVDHEVNLESSESVISEIPEVHQYCKITKLREALEQLKNRNHTLRKLLKQRDCLLSSSTMQQGSDKQFPYYKNHNGDNNNEIDRADSKESTRELVGILKILQSKCRIKDGMIVTLADELREYANNEKLKRILVKLTDTNIDCDNIDFDRSTLWKYLVSKEFNITKQSTCPKKNIVHKKGHYNELTFDCIKCAYAWTKGLLSQSLFDIVPTNGMNFFDGRHYRINKFFLSVMGQWPYQTIGRRYCTLIVLFMLAGTQIIAKLCATIPSFHDINVALADMAPLIADVVALIKIINSTVQMKKMRKLLNRIQIDYASLTTEGETKIMQGYAEGGRKFTIMYSGVFVVTLLCFLIPSLKAMIFSKDDRSFVHHTEYFVDPLDYYYPIIIHSYITIFLVIFTIVTMDTTLVILVQHVCGLFAALGYRICHIIDDDAMITDVNPSKRDDKPFESIKQCVRKHQEAIEFSKILKSYYSTSFFMQVGINMLAISITSLQAMTTNETNNFFQHFSIFYSSLAHIFFECANGQRLIDHSGRIHEYLISMNWYKASLRTKRVIHFMLIRSRVPCKLTAANMLNISMETFSVVVRTSISYFTMLRSMQ